MYLGSREVNNLAKLNYTRQDVDKFGNFVDLEEAVKYAGLILDTRTGDITSIEDGNKEHKRSEVIELIEKYITTGEVS